MTDIDRRTFLTGLSAASAFTIVPRRVLGGQGFVAPSDMIRLAQVGCGLQLDPDLAVGRDGDDRLGASANGNGELVGRRPQHGGRRRDSWRGQRGADGRRRVERQSAVELPDQPALEGLADDLHV